MTTVSTILKYDLSGSSGVVGESPFQAKAKLDELHTWTLTDKLNKLTMYKFTVPNTEFYRANAIIERNVFVPFLKPFRGIVCAKEQNESTITLTACELAFHLTRRIFRKNGLPRVIYGSPRTHIKFESDVLDKGVQSNDGTWNGTERYLVGHIGTTGDFRGTNSVRLANESNFDRENNQPFTWMCRFRVEATGPASLEYLMSKTATGVQGITVGVTSGDKINVRLINTATSDELDVDSTTTVSDGRNHHLAIVKDVGLTATALKIYIDGVLETNIVNVDNLAGTILNAELFTIAGTNDGTSEFDGLVDEVQIWHRVLSPESVLGEAKRSSNLPENADLNETIDASVIAQEILTHANTDMPSDITWKLSPDFPTGDVILSFHYQNHYECLNLIAESLGKDLFFDNKTHLVFIETKGKSLGKSEKLDIIITSKPEVTTEDFANDINMLGKKTGIGVQLEHRVQTPTVLRFNYEKVVADNNLNTQDQLSDVGNALLTEFQKLTPQTKGEVPVTQFHRLALSSGDIVKIAQPDKQLSGSFRVMDIIVQPNKVKVSLEKIGTAIVRVRSSSLVDVIDGILKRLQEQSIET